MKRLNYLFIVLVTLTSCELIVIGTKKDPVIEINQDSPIGAVYLFKAELDSSNVPAATQIMASPNGTELLAYEKYELYDEIARLERLIGRKPITKVKADSLSTTNCRVSVEFDYLKTINFNTQKIRDAWYIIGYLE